MTIGRLLLFLVLGLTLTVSVGGGATYVALEITTKPKFCRTCHNMEPYYDSWATSSHKNVACVDCHYEPGLLETFEGKFKALSQLAKYVTGTEGTKPWAEVSDYSCMRSGCHNTRLLEGQIRFGRVQFDHRDHLVPMKRGKHLRCTSCHGQIVQGDHLTVTTTSCFLCHFKKSEGSKPIDDCNLCHGPPPEEIRLGDFTFRHSEYLERGVQCASCHGDVTRGTGDVPRQRCGSCHNKQEHLERYSDVDFMHQNHVTKHSVSCTECHTEIQHGLPPREQHYRGDCKDCHVGAHAVPADIYRGTGGRSVKDQPSVMYLARVTCNGCHRPPFPGAPQPLGGGTFKADDLACLDCHGAGYEGMSARWQKELRQSAKDVQQAMEKLDGLLADDGYEADAAAKARGAREAAAYNLGLVLLDKSGGVHNLPYSRDLLRQASTDLRDGFQALEEKAPSMSVGPKTASREGCTNLCHVGVEERQVASARDLPFAHATHFQRGKLDCSTCHRSEPHGTTAVQRADCMACHHKSESPDTCGKCHGDVADLRAKVPEGVDKVPMADLDCLACHESLAEGHSLAGVKQACDGCHKDDGADFAAKKYDGWVGAALGPLGDLERLLSGAPEELQKQIRPQIEAMRRAGPHHNVAWVQAEAARLAALLPAPK